MTVQGDNPDKRTDAAELAAIQRNSVTVPADKLAELQRKAGMVDELLVALKCARVDIWFYGEPDLNKTIEDIDKAIAKAKEE